MIIPALCNTCLQPYSLRLEASDKALLNDLYVDGSSMVKCPRLCGGVINTVVDETISEMTADPRLKALLSINAQELYRASYGHGLPDEIPVTKDVVELLMSTKIQKVVTETGEASGCTFLHEIHFEGGRVLHLTSGGRGAVVLKITKEKV